MAAPSALPRLPVVFASIILLGRAWCPAQPDAPAPEVWLLGGQSNMQGIAKVADIPADTPKAMPEVFFWTGRDFQALTIGATQTSTRAGEFGPEIGLALALAKPGRSVHLIKFAASGMPLHPGWNGDKWAGLPPQPGRRNFYPGEKPDDPNTGTLYREMRTRFQSGLAFLKKSGARPVVRGFIWMQGEQDAKNEESAGGYARSLRQLHDRLAQDLEAGPALPMVFGQVLPHEPALPRFTCRALIRTRMAAADERSGQAEAIPRVRMVSTDGFGVLADTVHFDAPAQLKLGRAFAATLAEMGK